MDNEKSLEFMKMLKMMGTILSIDKQKGVKLIDSPIEIVCNNCKEPQRIRINAVYKQYRRGSRKYMCKTCALKIRNVGNVGKKYGTSSGISTQQRNWDSCPADVPEKEKRIRAYEKMVANNGRIRYFKRKVDDSEGRYDGDR